MVVVAIAALAALPFAARLLPAGHSTIGARGLLARIQSSTPVAYSGYAESQGGLALPVSAGQFNVINDLFGGASQLRVWWRASDDWRVDSIGVTGETDVHQDAAGTWTWDYESNTARRNSRSTVPIVRLPRNDDLVPANLARRLLSEADPAQVTRLADARIAGHETAGLRLRVDDKRSTIVHIDVWALPSNGLPVRVQVYGASPKPVLATSFLDLSTERPAPATTVFHGSPGERFRDGQFADIVAAIDRFGRSEPPQRIAGLTRRADLDLGAVGVYGRGVNLLVAVPLSSDLAGQIVPQLRHTPGMVEDESGIAVGVGPLNLQLSPPTGFGARWLLAGTLTARTLVAAVPALPPAHGFGFD